jgi:hypothetical protein
MHLVIAALFLLLFTAPAMAQARQCDQAVGFQHATATGPVEIVPGIAGQRIYPCGFSLMERGAALSFRIFGAQPGTNCTVEGTTFTPTLDVPNDVQFNNRVATVGPASAEGNALCIQTIGTGALSGVVYFAQF